MWVFRVLSALLFMIGWAAIAIAGVGTWFYISINFIMSFGWFVGMIFSIASVLAIVYWENYVKVPFLLWLQLWEYADRMILHRNR